MPDVPLLTKTRELLIRCREPLNKIATGTKFGYEWLRKFKAGLIPDPSVNKVQELHDRLLQLAQSPEMKKPQEVPTD